MKKDILSKITLMLTIAGLASCSSMELPSLSSLSFTSHTKPTGHYNASLWAGTTSEIWNKLVRTSSAKLVTMEAQTTDPTQKAWIQLALITKRYSTNNAKLTQEVLAWKQQNPSHPANAILPNDGTLNNITTAPTSKQIAVLIPEQGAYASAGQAVRAGIMQAYYSHPGKLGVKFYDTTGANLADLYQRAVSEGATFVIGPLTKEEVRDLSQSTSFSVLTLALNYTDNSLPANFYEFGLLPEDEAGQLAERARKGGQSRALIIAPQSAWGNRLVSTFTDRWEAMGGSISETWYFSANTNFNQTVPQLLHVNPNSVNPTTEQNSSTAELAKKRRQDFDVIFLFSQPQYARQIVPLLRYYYVNNVPIYATSAVYSGKPNPTKDVDIEGVIVCDIPWGSNGSNDTVKSDRLFAVGQDAYLLSQTLTRLINMPKFPIYGKTGALTLGSDHKIHRSLPCKSIRNGQI
ncbi:MAG: hypothetical protein ACD_46C00428G0004 [uncultured bacterium]|nr:MAG: hypothetical protein ACD_46C00428G0004 [uncultured bacterium]